MGVSRREMIVYGVKLTYEEYDKAGGYEKFEEYHYNKKKEGVAIVSDGMNGEYAIVGVFLFIGGDHRFDDDTGIPIMELKQPDSIVKEVIQDFVKERFEITREAKLYALSHYY